MPINALPPPHQCPDQLDHAALQLSFDLLRAEYPALALRVRNAMPTEADEHQQLAAAALPGELVHEVIAVLSGLSKSATLPKEAPALLTLRKILLIWMDYEQLQRAAGGEAS